MRICNDMSSPFGGLAGFCSASWRYCGRRVGAIVVGELEEQLAKKFMTTFVSVFHRVGSPGCQEK